MANRYTYRKYMGDDIYSYAVFDYGRPIMTGLSRDSARYECDIRNPPKPDVRAERIPREGRRPSVYVIYDYSDSKTFGRSIGYAVGARGHWEVFDGAYLRRRKASKTYNTMYGRVLGTAKTIKEACEIASAPKTNTIKKGK